MFIIFDLDTHPARVKLFTGDKILIKDEQLTRAVLHDAEVTVEQLLRFKGNFQNQAHVAVSIKGVAVDFSPDDPKASGAGEVDDNHDFLFWYLSTFGGHAAIIAMQITIKPSLVEVLGMDSGGVSCNVALTLEDDFSFESVYWAHPNGNRVIETEERFLRLFGAASTAELPFYEDLLVWVAVSLPTLDELLTLLPPNDNPEL